MKLEIIIDQAYTSLLNKKLNLEYWNKSFELEIININKIYRKDFNKSEDCPYKYFELNNINCLKKHTEKTQYDITFVFFAYPSIDIFNLLSQSQRNIYVILKDYLPTNVKGSKIRGILPKIITNLNFFGIMKIYHLCIKRSVLTKKNIKAVCLFGGEDGKRQYRHLIGKNTKIIQSYCSDAEIIKKLSNKVNIQKNNKKKLAIFIDQGIPTHPDFLEINLNINEERYHRKLNNFFLYLEKSYNYKIIIMGHPRIKYEKNPFGSREILYGKTAEYSNLADLIITFSSAAISYGVILKKNILLLATTKLLLKIHYIKAYQSYLGCQIINISHKKFPKIKENIDLYKYQEYENLFIGDYKKHKSPWSPLISELSRLKKSQNII